VKTLGAIAAGETSGRRGETDVTIAISPASAFRMPPSPKSSPPARRSAASGSELDRTPPPEQVRTAAQADRAVRASVAAARSIHYDCRAI